MKTKNLKRKQKAQPGGSLEPVGSARRPKLAGWWEEYRCGCVSKTVRRKKDLLGYCGQHGDSRRQVFPDIVMPNESGDRLMALLTALPAG